MNHCRAIKFNKWDEGFHFCEFDRSHKGKHGTKNSKWKDSDVNWICGCTIEGFDSCREFVSQDGELCDHCKAHEERVKCTP